MTTEAKLQNLELKFDRLQNQQAQLAAQVTELQRQFKEITSKDKAE
jgi:hypothetical protein